MTNDPQQRHKQMLRLFAGDFGDDIYESAVLSGDRQSSGRSLLRAYVGLYADKRLSFVPVNQTRLTEQSAYARIKRLEMSPEDAAVQYTQVKIMNPGSNTGNLDDLMWHLAAARTKPLGLPLGFVTFLATARGDQKIVFWYSRMAQGDWMLKQIKSKLR